MIEFLTAPILKDFISWFLDLFKFANQQSKTRFEKIFDPVYLDMIKIHNDYNSMFSKVLETLPIIDANNKNFAYVTQFDKNFKIIDTLVKVSVDSSDYKDSLLSIKRVLNKD